ncbi:MAG: hypothetical protein HFI63_11135 [Lachnospiraceae bacterium]|nr:hypothetical protein [Lachnospiraceae bacterium]
MLKSFYWQYISTIDDPWRYHVIDQDIRYWPSFFKIHSPEEAAEIIENDRKMLYAALEELGEWEKAWKEKEKSQETL